MLQLAEVFYTVQGEGAWTGTPAVFVRLAGCNLSCAFCDTDYALKFFAPVAGLVARVRAEGGACPMVILTGGEPLAQRETPALIDALRADGRVPGEWLASFPPATPVFLQPEGNKPANVALAMDAALREPARYRLSLQTHKFIGVR